MAAPRCPRHPDDELKLEEPDNQPVLICAKCGYSQEVAFFSKEPTFTKGAGGESTVDGQYVSEGGGGRGLARVVGNRVYGHSDPHEKALRRGRDEVEHLVNQLAIHPHGDTVDGAHRLYALSLQQDSFTRGRRIAQVAGACLYIYLRSQSRPYMLIDISDALQTNVYVLGAVFLQLCRKLCLEKNEVFTSVVDPSLYIERFVGQLSCIDPTDKELKRQVTNTSLRFVKSMKRDWMQTGRRPSGICGAAIFIACHVHGLEPTRRDIIAKVHIGEVTLAKRIAEFSDTGAADLTLADFDDQQRSLDATESGDAQAPLEAAEGAASGSCPHLGEDQTEHYAAGMCRNCYLQFLELSGGFRAGANPPCFEKTKKKRGRKRKVAAIEGPEDGAEAEEEVMALPAPEDVDDCRSEELDHELDAALHGELRNAAEGVGLDIDADRPMTRSRKRAAEKAAALAGAQSEEQTGVHRRKSRKPARAASGGCRSGRGRGSLKAALALAEKREAAMEAAAAKQQAEQPGQPAAAVPSEAAEASRLLAGMEPDLGALVVHEGGEDEGHEAPGQPLVDDLADMSDGDLDQYIVPEGTAELRAKTEAWETVNRVWIEAQEVKRQREEEAAKAAEERERAEAEGLPKKKRRGRPAGAKTKPRQEDNIGDCANAGEAVMRLFEAKKMSSKVNQAVLDELFGNGSNGTIEGGDEGDEDAAEMQAQRELASANQERLDAHDAKLRTKEAARQDRERKRLEREEAKQKQQGLDGIASSGLPLGILGRVGAGPSSRMSPGALRRGPTSPTARRAAV